MKTKIKKRSIIIIAICIVILLGSSLITMVKLNSRNPFMSAYGLIAIKATDAPYKKIQLASKVFIGKPGDLDIFYKCMNDLGYIEIEDERMGSLYMFEKDGEKQPVHLRMNGYYSIWSFE